MLSNAKVAYFSMEIGLESNMPTYAGGLGVLAGDTLRSAADIGVPIVGVTLLHRRGYFVQELDDRGEQTEHPASWSVEDYARELPGRASIELEGRTVLIRAWCREINGVSGFCIPVLFLDTLLEENAAEDRALTGTLYGGDGLYRLRQEAVLGIGGVRMLRALGCTKIERFHMNEGHAALLAVELQRESEDEPASAADHMALDEVRQKCVFTTHTPVPAGHDRFSRDLVTRALGQSASALLAGHDLFDDAGVLNMTALALHLSRYVNGVAKRHGETTREMFAQYSIDSITNGVHLNTWASPPFQRLFDERIPGWRSDNLSLRFALGIPEGDIGSAHREAKDALIDYVNRHAPEQRLASDQFTIAFARRSTAYKRPDLLFTDLERLRSLARDQGPFQVIFAGKAHPDDRVGKELIRGIYRAAADLRGSITVVYLPDYDIDLARLLTSGADLWLNTPAPPQEASGTSGMKAAVNGVPSLSVLDGWWLEGCVEGVTGWGLEHSDSSDASVLYDKLGDVILPMFHGDRDAFTKIMRFAIAINGSFFNTERMLREYVVKAYFPSLRDASVCSVDQPERATLA